MGLELKLSMKLGQQMVMTPQLQQAIKLLQMNRLELTETIQNELLENPMLEEGVEISELDQKKADMERSDSSDDMKEVSPEKDKNPDFDWDSYLEQSFSYTGKSKPGMGYDPNTEDGPGFEAMTSKELTLADHLRNQLHTSELNENEREFAHSIIGSLDEWGYLREPIEEIARQESVDLEFAETVLSLVQRLDPPGVAARDLKECLLIQLDTMKIKRKSDKDLLQQLIEEQLHNLEKKNYKAITKDMGLELGELGDLIQMLQKFEPRPARQYSQIENPYITPDIYIRKVNDEFVITMNEDGLPKLKISHLYRNLLKQLPEAKELIQIAQKPQSKVEEELEVLASKALNKSKDELPIPEEGKELTPDQDPKAYIQGKLRGALWLIRSIHQRQRTIYKVTESIVKNQRDFLEHGISHLKPMVLKDIASDIGMHESTISRVTSNKYVHTPKGIYELKYFFSSSIQKTNGQGIAAESVKDKIKLIVGTEDKKNPVSDQGIVDELKKQGIEIARRTVAKYREMLNILPSSQRKSIF